MTYPPDTVAWLYDYLTPPDDIWRPTITELLTLDAQYPGLIEDLRVMAWQVGLFVERFKED